METTTPMIGCRLPVDLIEALDIMAAERMQSRSDVIRTALVEYIRAHEAA
jgi:metal-responsive CopG/Arc/MetJ family transcriptional regulator